MAQMSIASNLHYDLLQNRFGYDAFRGTQEQVIKTILNGHNVLAVMATGGGKSLCYQIPALCRDGIGVVISPLIALMDDQVRHARDYGMKAAALHSGQSPFEQDDTIAAIRNSALDLIYVSPERFFTPQLQNLLSSHPPALIAIDEAHCMVQWGHDFRPEYARLSEVTTLFPNTPVLALTASAAAPSRQYLADQLDIHTEHIILSDLDRPNIDYRTIEKTETKGQIIDFIRNNHMKQSGIIYAATRNRTEWAAKFLNENGIKASAYHAGLDPVTRKNIQNEFIRSDDMVIVATTAFGMGINKPDIRFVLHIDLPRSIEAYYQESGRAGRDGNPANSVVFYRENDLNRQIAIVANQDLPNAQKQIQIGHLQTIFDLCISSKCKKEMILDYFLSQS